MHSIEVMDFSGGTGFREELLRKIKAECFSELSDEDLDYVNAAGVPLSEKTVTIILTDQQ